MLTTLVMFTMATEQCGILRSFCFSLTFGQNKDNILKHYVEYAYKNIHFNYRSDKRTYINEFEGHTHARTHTHYSHSRFTVSSATAGNGPTSPNMANDGIMGFSNHHPPRPGSELIEDHKGKDNKGNHEE